MNSRILLLTISLGLCVSNVNAGVGKCHSGDCAVVMPPAPRQAPNITTTPAAVPTPGTISPDGTCGGTKKYQCKGSTFGECCSASGFCGSTTGHCQAGCQITFGNCTNPPLSLDGTCGGTNKYQCKGSGFGDCCSSSGYCGSTNAHCTAGCQVSFGSCNSTDISPDGTCGGPQKYKCQDSAFGNCCSSGGYCGSSVNHCAQGCQTSFSSACITSNIPSLDGSCGSSKGFTCAGGPFNGQCCSSDGFCGTTDGHCNSGCQKDYGTCK